MMATTSNDMIYFLSPLTLAAVINDLHEGANDPELMQHNRTHARSMERACRQQLKLMVGADEAKRLIKDAKSV